MPKVRSQKEVLLAQYKDIIASNPGFFAVDASKLSNISVTTLKQKLKEIGSDYIVVKNTIFKIALDDAKKPVELSQFEGQTAVISYSADPTEVAKLLKTAQKETQLMEARYGLIDGQFVGKDEVMALADIPSKPQLLSMLLSTMNAPLSGLMNAVTGNVRGFVQVLSQMSEKEQEA